MTKEKIYTLIHSNIYDGTLNMNLLEDSMIEIRGNKITRIGKFEIEKSSKVIDLEGKFVVPGLINLHSHLPSSGKIRKKKLSDTKKLVSFITSSKLMKQIGLLICKPQLKQSLYSGVTTVRTVGGIADLDTNLRDKINKRKILGPRLIVSNCAIGVEGGHMVGTVAQAVNNIEDARKCIDRLNRENVDLIKLMITGGVLDGKEPGTPGLLAMSEELVKFCCEYSHQLGLKVAAHVEGKEGMKVAMKYGVDSIEHSTEFPIDYIEDFKKRNGAIVLTLSPALPFIELDPQSIGYEEIARINSKIVFDSMLKSYKLCRENNINVGLGTDAGSTLSPHYNFYKELIIFSSFCHESSSYALHLATLANAKIAGIDNITGSIEEGKCADLLIIENDPLKDLENLGEPYMIFANGTLIRNPKSKHDSKIDSLLSKINHRSM